MRVVSSRVVSVAMTYLGASCSCMSLMLESAARRIPGPINIARIMFHFPFPTERMVQHGIIREHASVKAAILLLWDLFPANPMISPAVEEQGQRNSDKDRCFRHGSWRAPSRKSRRCNEAENDGKQHFGKG